jgi:hypothetical protein
MTIVNGKVDTREKYRNAFPEPPDRVLEFPNFSLELSKTPDGGWKEETTDAHPLGGGSSHGQTLANLAKHYPWVSEQMWRRIIELEDELRALRNAISYKEPSS